MFKLSRSMKKPAASDNAQRGFPAIGAGSQTTGEYTPPPARVSRTPTRPTKGRPSLFVSTSEGRGARGFPSPTNEEQARPANSMPNVPPIYGGNIEVETPYYSRGAAAFVQNYGKVLTNPIGAGVVAMHRPQASYGPAAQYYDQAIWWTTQAIPTSINMQGLTNPDVLAAILSQVEVQAVVRTG